MTQAPKERKEKYQYLAGFDGQHVTEALPGAVPFNQNSPQVCPYGLYAEQLSGSAFTAPRSRNQKTWLYRIRPSVTHIPFVPYEGNPRLLSDFSKCTPNPNQLRWRPFDIVSKDAEKVDFLHGLFTVAGAGDPSIRSGIAVHMYCANSDMEGSAFNNSDGDMLIVPQQGRLDIQTEHGFLEVNPNEICVIQRGIRFAVRLPDGPSRGYICEVYNGHFELPELGPIGANGLANPRHFKYPTAAFEEKSGPFKVFNKFQGALFVSEQDHSPFDVVGWSGNYAPYKYDLALFNTFNSVSYDHADPCIFTVLTCKSNEPGTAVADFAIFPPRWGVANHTFRPPYYHRNCMSEFMGLIFGEYEAKKDGFLPGGGSLHSIMTPHGPDKAAFDYGSTQTLQPQRIADGTMAFMFESVFHMKATDLALKTDKLDKDYYKAWVSIPSNFNPNWKPSA